MFDWRFTRFPILASTNDLALEWIKTGQARAGDVIVTAEQTSGRGRPGRTWHSPKGALLCTVVLPFTPERAGWTALAAGIAVAQAARDLGAEAGVKWPNDVVLNGKKLAGILVETSTPGLVAVGIGMNVTNPLPTNEEVAARSIRLADVNPDVSVEAVLLVLLRRLGETWSLLLAPDLEPLKQRWAELDTTTGRAIRWSETGQEGVAEALDENGNLIIRLRNGKRTMAQVGEITFLEQ